VTAPRFSASAVRTLEAAVGRPADVHSWVISDASAGTTKGIYASEALATDAFTRLMQPGRVYVLTVLHPDKCGCPEVAA